MPLTDPDVELIGIARLVTHSLFDMIWNSIASSESGSPNAKAVLKRFPTMLAQVIISQS